VGSTIVSGMMSSISRYYCFVLVDSSVGSVSMFMLRLVRVFSVIDSRLVMVVCLCGIFNVLVILVISLLMSLVL